MNDDVLESVAEVCRWKDEAAEETRGMSRAEVIEFYRRKADEFQRKLGLELVCRPASAPNNEGMESAHAKR